MPDNYELVRDILYLQSVQITEVLLALIVSVVFLKFHSILLKSGSAGLNNNDVSFATKTFESDEVERIITLRCLRSGGAKTRV